VTNESKSARFLQRVIERNRERRELAIREAELHAMKIHRAEQQLDAITEQGQSK
jgi:hypothetical protein